MTAPDMDTPIFDELRAERAGEKPAPYRHASGDPCHGCQSCLADAADYCPSCGSSIRRPAPTNCADDWHDPEGIGTLQSDTSPPAPTHETCKKCGEPQGSADCRCGQVIE